MNYSWNWSILIQQPYLGWLVSGLELTLVISLSAWVLALIAGTLVGVAGTLPSSSSTGAGCDLCRAVS